MDWILAKGVKLVNEIYLLSAEGFVCEELEVSPGMPSARLLRLVVVKNRLPLLRLRQIQTVHPRMIEDPARRLVRRQYVGNHSYLLSNPLQGTLYIAVISSVDTESVCPYL